MVDKRIRSDETACMTPSTSQVECLAARSVRFPRQPGMFPSVGPARREYVVSTNMLNFAGAVSRPALTMNINRPNRRAGRFNMEWQK